MNRDEVFRAEHFNAARSAHVLSEAASREPSMGKIGGTQDAHCAEGEGMCFLRDPKDVWLAPSNGVSVLG